MISIEDIKYLEELSNLEFSDEEKEKFLHDFDEIINFASQITNVDCKNEAFINTIDMEDLRDDNIKPSLSQAKIVSNAPEKCKGCFVVPRIME